MSVFYNLLNQTHSKKRFNSSFHLYRCISFSSLSLSKTTTTPSSLDVNLSHPIYMIWGSNTSVGKTLVSTGLATSILSSSCLEKQVKFNYIKPVQTGFPLDSDSRFVYRKISEFFVNRKPEFSVLASNHGLKASVPAWKKISGVDLENEGVEKSGGLKDLCWYEERRIEGIEKDSLGAKLVCKTICGWKEAISPHLAVQREGGDMEDSWLLDSLQKNLVDGGNDDDGKRFWTIVETAGGVASPGPSGSLQCDLYRPFRLPAILVGDGRLGGISGTISAYESLKLRGYDVAAIIIEDHGLLNEESLISYLRNRVPVLVLPSVPRDQSNNLMEWFGESQNVFKLLSEIMQSSYSERLRRLQNMPKKAQNIFWWPFTQHGLVPEENVTVIDSRCGENFAVHKDKNHDLITQQFDACASWWTQGPDATLQVELARDMGYSAARFGHVMFPENVYEPALRCAELLLEGVGRGWASRTFFSDNGSTAIEIALKMAFRKFSSDHGILLDLCNGNMFFSDNGSTAIEIALKMAFRKFSSDHGILLDLCNGNMVEKHIEFKVLALNGSYHGDTLGAMEAQAPSSYTGFLQQPWYRGRGVFLDPPTVFIHSRTWKLTLPKALQFDKHKPENMTFSSQSELFCGTRDASDLGRSYSAYISEQLSQLLESGSSVHIGALILEPVIHAAGGMHMIDPLFQRILVNDCQSRRIPVIFDEVFTGFWRLGIESAAGLLGCLPDIACYGKLMTGGIIPLAATLASDAVFNAFKGDSKLMALLHGHSYSAHAMGCTAAVKAIQWFKDPLTNLNITSEGRQMRELWDAELASQISSHPGVKRVVMLGTLFALELEAQGSDVGYASMYAISLLRSLREDGIYMRPLGNVIYLMCGPCTSPRICTELLNKLYRGLQEFDQSKVERTQNFADCKP